MTAIFTTISFLLTFFIIGASWGVYKNEEEISPESLGALMSGASSSIAIIWILFGFYIQFKSLMIQSEEKAVLIKTVDLQSKELRAALEANSQNAFHSLLSAAEKALELDARSIVRTCLKQDDKISIFMGLESEESALGGDKFVRYLATDPNIHEWLNSEKIKTAVALPDMLRSYIRKWEAIEEEAKKIPSHAKIYMQILDSSNYAKNARFFQGVILNLQSIEA